MSMQHQSTLAILTDDPSRADAVMSLAAERNWQVLPLVGRADPVADLQNRVVNLILVDLDLPDAVPLLRRLAAALPNLPLLALAGTHHLIELQDARLAGAVDFITYPLSPRHFFTTLDRSLRDTSGVPARRNPGRIVAIVGLKGGVGRSTIAANLAVALCQRQAGEVILIEAHHSLSQLALLLNLHPAHTLANLATETTIDQDLVQGYLHRHQSGVRLLAAPSELTELVELPVESWRHILGVAAELATTVIVDTAATADELLSTVLTQADEIVVVTGPEIASLYSTRGLLQLLRAEKEVRGHIHLVLNQAEISGGLSASMIEKQIGERICASIFADQPVATYALNRGIPFVLSHPRALISRRLHQLAEQLHAETAGEPATTPQPRKKRFALWGGKK
jgi:pilus assembly protein CpaE